MSNAKTKKGSVGARAKGRGARTTLATVFVTNAAAAPPKGVTGFTVRASGLAAEALAGRPAKVKALLQSYGEAYARSRATGRAMSFRVDVDPIGGATVTPVEERIDEAEILSVEKAGAPSPELKRALDAARARGRLRAAEILSGEDMLSAEDFAKLLGTTRVTVNTKRQNGQLLGLDGATRGFRFPVWQLNREGKPYPELASLQTQLGGPWALYRFLVQPHGALDGLTGRAALEKRRSRSVIAAAEGIGNGDFL